MEVNLCEDQGSLTQRTHKDLYYKGTRKAWGGKTIITPQKNVPASKNIGSLKNQNKNKFNRNMENAIKDLSDTFLIEDQYS